MADNTLRGGAVLDPDPDPGTRAVQEADRWPATSPEVVTVVLPFADGVTSASRRG